MESTNLQQSDLKENYREFKGLIELFQKGLERFGLENATEFQEKQEINLFFKKSEAYREIKHLLTVPNNGRESLIYEVKRDCSDIAGEFERIIQSHDLLKQAQNLDKNAPPKFPGESIDKGELPETNDYFQKLSASDQSIFKAFTFVSGIFFEFYRDVWDIIGPELETLNKNENGHKADQKGKPETVRGFKSNLSKDQLRGIYQKARGKFIDPHQTTETNFIAAFTNEPVPNDFEPIKWVYRNNGRGHKEALRQFLEKITDTKKFWGNKIHPLFRDKNGNKLKDKNGKSLTSLSYNNDSPPNPDIEGLFQSLK